MNLLSYLVNRLIVTSNGKASEIMDQARLPNKKNNSTLFSVLCYEYNMHRIRHPRLQGQL